MAKRTITPEELEQAKLALKVMLGAQVSRYSDIFSTHEVAVVLGSLMADLMACSAKDSKIQLTQMLDAEFQHIREQADRAFDVFGNLADNGVL